MGDRKEKQKLSIVIENTVATVIGVILILSLFAAIYFIIR